MPRGYPGSVAPHGTAARYGSHGCRCEACLAAWRERYYPRRRARAEYDAERVARADATHGQTWTYRRGCRCDECRAAEAAARKRRRHNGTVLTHNASGYANGCRCIVCTAGHAEKKRLYRAAK